MRPWRRALCRGYECKRAKGVGGCRARGRIRPRRGRRAQDGSSLRRTLNKVFAKEVDHHKRSQSRGGPWTGSRHTFSGRKRHMHSPILPNQGSFGPTLPAQGLSSPITPPVERDLAGNLSTFASELHASDHAFGMEAPAGSPPPEVLDQMEAAGRICRQLLESGQRLRFSVEPEGGVKIELADREGIMRAVSPAEALDIAAGKSLE
jgi:hypothetical protein